MYKAKFLIAGLVFEVDCLFSYFLDYAKEYITFKEVDYKLTNTLEELEEWKKEHHDESESKLVEVLLIQSKVASILAERHIFIIHGSSIYLDNKDNGYIFTGVSGVGKSTHVNRLIKAYRDRISIINDDKPFVSYEDDNYYIYGSPWSGKSHLSRNIKVHLKGIFILEQAKDNKIIQLEAKEAINYLYKQIYIPRGDFKSDIGLSFLISLCKKLKIYKFYLNLDEDVINYSMNIMEKE